MAYLITRDCTGCDICRPECPEDAIKENHPFFYVEPRRCNDCGVCAEVCPVGACLPEEEALHSFYGYGEDDRYYR